MRLIIILIILSFFLIGCGSTSVVETTEATSVDTSSVEVVKDTTIDIKLD